MKNRFSKMLKKKLNNRSISGMFLVYTSGAFLIIITVLTCLVVKSYTSYIAAKRIEINAAISRIELSFSETISYSESIVDHIARQIMFSGGGNKEIGQILKTFGRANYKEGDLIKDVLSISMFSWVDKDQYIVVNSESGKLEKAISMRELNRYYLKQTIRNPGKVYIGSIVNGAVSGQKIIPGGFGVISAKDGKYMGSIVFGFTVKGITEKLERVLSFSEMNFAILDENNNLILQSGNSSFEDSLGDFHYGFGTAKTESKMVYNFSIFDSSGSFLFVKDLENYNYRILVGYKNSVILSDLLIFFIPYLVGSLLTIILFCGIWCALKKRVINPILQLSKASKLIADDRDNEVVIPEIKIAEISDLADQIVAIGKYKFDLLQAKTSQERFFANMNHELRTPLNGILNFSLMIKNEMMGPLSKDYKEMASDINSSGRHLLNLINDILDFAKMDLGKVKISEEKFDVTKEVNEALKIAASDILVGRDFSVRIYSEVMPNLEKFYGDRRMFKQILLNLLSNAVKFTNKGMVSLKIFKDDNQSPVIVVKDTGIGIKEEDLSKLAVEFGQVGDGLTRDKKQGSGLGLFLVKKMVELHEGSFKIESVYGQGTTITITFPKYRLSN